MSSSVWEQLIESFDTALGAIERFAHRGDCTPFKEACDRAGRQVCDAIHAGELARSLPDFCISNELRCRPVAVVIEEGNEFHGVLAEIWPEEYYDIYWIYFLAVLARKQFLELQNEVLRESSLPRTVDRFRERGLEQYCSDREDVDWGWFSRAPGNQQEHRYFLLDQSYLTDACLASIQACQMLGKIRQRDLVAEVQAEPYIALSPDGHVTPAEQLPTFGSQTQEREQAIASAIETLQSQRDNDTPVQSQEVTAQISVEHGRYVSDSMVRKSKSWASYQGHRGQYDLPLYSSPADTIDDVRKKVHPDFLEEVAKYYSDYRDEHDGRKPKQEEVMRQFGLPDKKLTAQVLCLAKESFPDYFR